MAQTARISAPDGEPGGRPKVLFVDDEKRVLNSMRALFRRDYDLHLTTDGAEAIRIAEAEGVDVVIADQRMPGLSGVEVLGEVRRRAPGAVRILLTGYADLDAIEGSINIGEVFRFLSKPCPPQELRETLAEAVQAARQTGAAARVTAVAEAAPEPAVRPVEAPAPAPAPAAQDHEATVPNLALELEKEAERRPPPAEPREETIAPESGADEEPVAEEIVLATEPETEFVDTIVIGDDSVPGSRDGACEDMDNVGVALFSSDATFTGQVERVLGDRYRVARASTLVQVTELLADAGAGVLVTDFCTDGAMLRNMLSTLKRYLPELITIVVSDERDAAEMISLINHGQVFRYMSKPMDEGRLVQNVNAAVLRHIQLRENPELVQRHSVVPDRPPKQGAALLAQFVSRIRGMRRLWART